MKLELEPNMYVRYISGFHHNEQNKPIVLIGKVLEITDNEMIKLDTFFGGWMFPIREFEKLMKGEPSFNPIDLIEKNDFVNGEKVSSIQYDGMGFEHIKCVQTIIEFDSLDNQFYTKTYYNKDIKSIVTKEQFEAMQYKIMN